jgi:hypothetical protein
MNTITREIKINAVKKVIEGEIKNKKLVRHLNKEFLSKGLNEDVPTGLFEQTLEWDKLSTNEQIAFVKGSYEILNWEDLNPSLNFQNEQLISYKAYFNTDKSKNLKEMVLDDIQRIDDLNFTGRVSYEQITLLINNVLWRYNPKTQRASTSKKVGTGFIREIDVNWNHVYDMRDLMIDKKFEDNQIVINILLTGDNNPDYEFLPEIKDNIGRLTVRPHHDVNAENFTVMNILDGYHRILAAREAFLTCADRGEKLEGGLDIRVVVRTVSQAVELIDQIFRRSDTRRDFKKATAVDNYNKFVDMLSKRSQVLNNEVELTFDECKIEEKLTYKVILRDTIKYCTKIDVNKIGETTKMSGKIAENIDMIINLLKELYFNNDIEEMKENSFLLKPNIFAGYIAMGYKIANTKDFYEYEKICEKLYNLKEDEVKELKLDNKSDIPIKDICNFFENLVSEVIKVA